MKKTKNLLDNLIISNQEIFDEIFKNQSVKIKRIVSNGQVSPEGFWYDQDEYEFVLVIKGKAILEFENRDITLNENNYVIIKPHEKHRVKYTSKPTIWLCVFFK